MKDLSIEDLLVLSCEKMEGEGYPSSSIKAVKTLIKAINANEGFGDIVKKFTKRKKKDWFSTHGEDVWDAVKQGFKEGLDESKKEAKKAEEEEGKHWISRHPIASTAIGAGAGAAVVGGAVYMGHHRNSNEGFGLDPDLFS